MIGPGKYDALCTLVRDKAKAKGAAVLVFDGKHGNGFSCQCDALTLLQLPDMLEFMAREIRAKGPGV